MNSSAVAVVGGGITGLTAAWRLQKLGIDVTLFEASEQVGGVIGTVEKDGYLIERGPNTLLETTPLIGEMIDELGLREHTLKSAPGAEDRFIIRRKEPVAVPSTPPAFFGSRLFSKSAKLRLLREPLVRKAKPEAEESLADFVRRRLGQEFLDYAINPFVAGIYAGDPEKLSLREAFPRLHAIEQNYGSLIVGQICGAGKRKKRGEMSKQNAAKLSFDRGLKVLPDALAAALGERIRRSEPVEEVHLENDGKWSVRLRSQNKPARYFDTVLLAMPAYRVASLKIGGKGDDLGILRQLADIKYPPVASVALGFHRDQVEHSLKGFGALIPEVEGFNILGTIFSSSLFPDRAPQGHVLLTSYLGGTRAPQLVEGRSHEELCATTLSDLRQLYGISGDPTFTHSVTHRRAIPQYNLGYRQFRESMTTAEKLLPGLFLAGHSRDGISLGDSMDSGDCAAGKIHKFLLKSV